MPFLYLLVLLVARARCEGEAYKRSADPGHVGYAGLSSLGAGAVFGSGASGAAALETGGKLLSQLVEVQNTIGIPSPVAVPHPVPVGVPVPISHPLPVKVPVPVPVVQTVPVPYERVVPYPVIRRVPVEVVRKVHVPVPDPYPVKVPIYKTKHIYYTLTSKYHHHW